MVTALSVLYCFRKQQMIYIVVSQNWDGTTNEIVSSWEAETRLCNPFHTRWCLGDTINQNIHSHINNLEHTNPRGIDNYDISMSKPMLINLDVQI